MTATALAALLSHWRRHGLQAATLLIGLALATALWTGVQAINAEARASYDEASATLGGGTQTVLRSADGVIDQSVFIALRRAGWLVSPVLEGEAEIAGQRVRIRGVEPLTAPSNGGGVQIAGGEDDGGLALAFIQAPGLVFAAPETVLALADAPGLPPLSGRAELRPGELLVDIGLAQRLLERPGEISSLIVLDGQPLNRPPLVEIAPDLVLEEQSASADIGRLADSFHLNLTAFGFLAFAVGLFIVHSAIGLAFEQRRSVFRTLRALGVPLRSLAGLLLAETTALALIAGLAGIGLGYLIARALLPDVAATLGGLYGAEVAREIALRPQWWASGLAMAVLGALAASAQGLWTVWRMPILASAQPRAWARASHRLLLLQAGAALIAFLTALLAWRFGSGLVGGFLMLGGLLIGAALALPLILSLTLQAGAALSRGPLAQWFWADTRQQLPGLSLALMALMLALAANIGVGTMVSSFRLTFEGWLDQRLAAELYVTARDETESQAIAAYLDQNAEAVLPIWSVNLALAETQGPAQAELYGVIDHATYRENWPLLQQLPDVWDRLAAGEGVLVNEQLWRREQWRVGQSLTLNRLGEQTILGVYSDYGNPIGQIIIALDPLIAAYPDLPRLRYGVRIAPDQAEHLRTDLIEEFDLPEGAVIAQAEIKDFSLRVFERTFAVTGALNLLTLGVAGFAMLAGLLTLSGLRLPQLAPVWALGLTRRKLALLEMLRAGILAALTLVLALPAGLALAWALLAVVNVEAFGWRLPLHVFPLDWLRLGALAVLAALIASAWPARRLATRPPRELLQVFAQMR